MKPSRTSGMIGVKLAGSCMAMALLAACHAAPPPDLNEPRERDGFIITREDIEQSGAKDGWEALRRGATHLNFQFYREGTPAGVTHRGVGSFYLSPQVLLVVDGNHMPTLAALETIRAENIDYIQILSARVGVVRYGTNAGNGVIVVGTGVPPAQ